METKVCRFCGEEKSVDDFRNYYDGRKGKYSYCLECERIETRRKYLKRKGDKCTPEQLQEIKSIERLYEARLAKGLSVPGHASRHKQSVADLVQQQLNSLK